MLARNQYGTTLCIPGIHPRKELLSKLGRKHADKIYVDRKEGPPAHVGYVIAGAWWTFYREVAL